MDTLERIGENGDSTWAYSSIKYGSSTSWQVHSENMYRTNNSKQTATFAFMLGGLPTRW